jgi:dimethylargininase
MDIAITRDVPRSITRCELTHIAREPIHFDRALAQHEAYCHELAALGLQVIRRPADDAHPDCCFVEDTAVVLDEVAVITALGAPSRRGETPAVASVLRRYRPLLHIELPATVEGGDVLRLGKTLFCGRTSRSNDAGIAALAAAVSPFGYRVIPVPVTGCLHLKSAVTALSADGEEETLLINPAWVEPSALGRFRFLEVAPTEPEAANVLRVRGTVLLHPGFPRTLERVARAGYTIAPSDISEFLKAEAALTCKSLLLRAPS